MKVVGINTWYQFTQGQCPFCHPGQKRTARVLDYFAVDLAIILPLLGKQTLPHLYVNVAAYVAQMLKIFARIMANFSALVMRQHPLHHHAVRLWPKETASSRYGIPREVHGVTKCASVKFVKPWMQSHFSECRDLCYDDWVTSGLPNLFSVAGHFHMRKFIAGQKFFCDVTSPLISFMR